jgi:hypothetical protein
MKNNDRFKTEIEDAFVVGDRVQLHGIVNADDTLTLRGIEKSDDRDDGSNEKYGGRGSQGGPGGG